MTSSDLPNSDESSTRRSPAPSSNDGTASFAPPAQGAEPTVADAPTKTKADIVSRSPVSDLGQFGKYTLLEAFSGGMGIVYKAVDSDLNRVVALKVLPQGPTAKPRARDRFWREARIVAALRHPFIIPIHEFSEHLGQPYFTTDFIEAGNLGQNLHRFCGDPRSAVVFMEKVARGVQHAHENNIIHRDLKPGNILVTDGGEPLIGDFGLAKMLDAEATATVDGSIIGTPAYMSPEQALGNLDRVGMASDIWSIGVVLYEMLSGERPFPGSGRESVTPRILHDAPPPLAHRATCVDAALDAIVMRCLEKDPINRYASAAQFADDLQAWLNHQEVQAWHGKRRLRRRQFLSAAGHWGGVALLGGAAFALRSRPTQPLRTLLDELERNNAVDLLDSSGRLRWHEWVCNAGKIDRNNSGGVIVESKSVGLLEVLTNINLPSFRFEAEIEHESMGDGSIGIYIGRTAWPGKTRTCHCYISLSVRLSTVNVRRKEGREYWTQMHAAAAIDDSGQTHTQSLSDQKLLVGDGARILALDVSPRRIQGHLNSNPVADDVPNQYIAKFGQLARKQANLESALPQFLPRDGIGIIVDRCRASITRLRVQRLPVRV